MSKPSSPTPSVKPGVLESANTLLSRIANKISDDPALMLSVLAASGYGLGVVSVSAFAAEFGASPSDLGIDFRDYVVLAIGNLFTVVAMALIAAVLLEVFMRATGCLRNLLALIGATTAALIVGAMTAVLSFDFYTVVATILVIYWLLGAVRSESISKATGFKRYVPVFLSAALFVVLLVNAQLTAARWAHRIEEWAEECTVSACESPPFGPPGLTLIIQPSVGTAITDEGVRSCVVRIGERVVTGTSAVVIADIEQFVAADCSVDEVPLTGRVIQANVYGLEAAGIPGIPDGTEVVLRQRTGGGFYVGFEDRLIAVREDDLIYEVVDE